MRFSDVSQTHINKSNMLKKDKRFPDECYILLFIKMFLKAAECS